MYVYIPPKGLLAENAMGIKSADAQKCIKLYIIKNSVYNIYKMVFQCTYAMDGSKQKVIGSISTCTIIFVLFGCKLITIHII